MLIVSNNLLSGKFESGAWQIAGGKRTTENYTAVDGSTIGTVHSRVAIMAQKLDIDSRPLSALLDRWAACSKAEREAWENKKSANAPIFDPDSWKARGVEKRDAEVRIYDNSVDIVLALVGTFQAQSNRKLEVVLAQAVLASETIKPLVASACSKTIAYVESLSIKPESARGGKDILDGEYSTLHGHTWKTWQGGYQKNPAHKNILALHDIYTFLDEQKGWTSPWTKTASPEKAKQQLFSSKATMRHNVGTVNEDSDWTARARAFDRPAWAGPSSTTQGLCWMLNDLAKVSPDELLACAYALFAVWASDIYPKTSTPIHHLFGVMSGAADYLTKPPHNAACQADTMYKYLGVFIGKAAL